LIVRWWGLMKEQLSSFQSEKKKFSDILQEVLGNEKILKSKKLKNRAHSEADKKGSKKLPAEAASKNWEALKSTMVTKKEKIEEPQSQSPSMMIENIFNPQKQHYEKDTNVLSLDCEMVGVDGYYEGLARISIINYNGHVLYDTFVKPSGKVTDFRTWVSGVTPRDLRDAVPYEYCRLNVIKMLKDKIIVGHTLKHDFKVLNYEHPQHLVRDLTHFKKFQSDVGHAVSLKRLSTMFLGKTIQEGSHCSIIDSRAALCLYRLFEKPWENFIKQKQYTQLKKRLLEDIEKKHSKKDNSLSTGGVSDEKVYRVVKRNKIN